MVDRLLRQAAPIRGARDTSPGRIAFACTLARDPSARSACARRAKSPACAKVVYRGFVRYICPRHVLPGTHALWSHFRAADEQRSRHHVGIRETVNQNRGVTIGAVAGVIVLAMVMIFRTVGGDSAPSVTGGSPAKCWYSIDDGQNYFA